MAFQLQANLARRLICDPVMAAHVLLGSEMDVFQRARFRYWWFTPTVMDHSGVSVAKSEMLCDLALLRLLLLPAASHKKPRIVTVYYPSQGTAEEVLLPKIDERLKRSNVFFRQVRRQHGGGFYRTKKNVILIEMRDGSWLEIPAGDFMKDSQNQASKRFNDLLADEVSKMDMLGQGVSKELMQRNTRECFNPNHPVHANKTLFLAHAEAPEHPYYKRYAGLRRKILQGSQDHVTLTSSYRDYRGEFYKRYGQDPEKKAKEQYLTELDEAEHAQVWDGLWKRGVKGLYSETMRDGIVDRMLRPHLRRAKPETIYGLGGDSSSGMADGNDWNAYVVMAADRVSGVPGAAPGYLRIGETVWHLRPALAVFLPPGTDVDQKSGLIHYLHLLFRFVNITLDNRGGGSEIAMKLRESRQLVNNEWVEVSGLCRRAESFEWPLAEPLVTFYDRGEPLLRPGFGERFVKDNTGPVDYAHREMRGMMRRGELAWTPGLKDLGQVEEQQMAPEEYNALADLERVLNEFGNIGVKVDKNGVPVQSDNGFQKYTHTRKKDGAMAALYSVMGLRAKLMEMFGGGRGAGDQGPCVGSY
jgi:hypothetical protein